MKHIILTGGGTAGHVTPNIAMIPRLQELGYTISYIGSYEGIEKKLIEEMGIPYYGISSGKLRRYFDLKNFTDPFRVLKGFGETRKLMKQLKPDVVFSKGGFVTVPVVIAASRSKVPTFIHESDMTPGLANKISIPFATKVCCNFPETVSELPADKAVLTGTPIRQELLSGDPQKALAFTGLSNDKPVIMVIGGSLGAVAVNNAVRAVLPELLKDFQVIHLCGKGKLDESLKDTKGYVQYEYIKKELADLFALADVVIFGESCAETCGIEYRSRTDYAVFGQVRKFVECISKDIHGVAYDYVCCVRSVFCYLGDNALCYVDVCLRKLKSRLTCLSCHTRRNYYNI